MDDEDDDDELSDEDEAEPKKDDHHDKSDCISLVAGRFSRGYCDEAHLIKNRRTVTNLRIRLAKLRFILLMSATPAPNRITDFLAYLELIQPDDVEDNDVWLNTVTTPDATVEYYKNPAVYINVKLNPAMFRFLCSNNDMHLGATHYSWIYSAETVHRRENGCRNSRRARCNQQASSLHPAAW